MPEVVQKVKLHLHARVSLTSSRPQELLIDQLLRNVRECE